LNIFQEECKTGGLYAEYESHDQLRAEFGQHLAIELNKPKYLWLNKPVMGVELKDPELNEDEKRLLVATASDQYGQILTGSTIGGFFVQTGDQNFVEDTPRSVATCKRTLRQLAAMGYLQQINEEIYEMTDEGFARADIEASLTPLEMSLSLPGTPENQVLSVESSKSIKIKQLDFLTSSEASIVSAKIDSVPGSKASIPLDHKKIVELFNAPRPDKNHSDHSGPGALRLIFELDGRQKSVVIPIVLQPVFVNNTQWIKDFYRQRVM
jgi:hypothetical protein